MNIDCTGHISFNTRPRQLCWGDWEMGTAVAGLICQLVLLYMKHEATIDLHLPD